MLYKRFDGLLAILAKTILSPSIAKQKNRPQNALEAVFHFSLRVRPVVQIAPYVKYGAILSFIAKSVAKNSPNLSLI